MLFKNSVRTSKRTPHFTITKINWLTLFKFNPLKPKRSWALTKTEGNKLKIFEREILRKIYGPINENGSWRSRDNHELYQLYEYSEIMKVIKTGRLRWLGAPVSSQ
jgi:hypothetical protein